MSENGIGRRSVHAATDIPLSVISALRRGERLHLRKKNADKILAVDLSAASDRTLIPAGPSWALLNELIKDGWPKTQLAAWLGSRAKKPALQIRRDRIEARTALRIERLYKRIREGLLRRGE